MTFEFEPLEQLAVDSRQSKVMLLCSATQRGLWSLSIQRNSTLITFFVCMILPGGGSRLQTLGGLAAQWFDSTLRTFITTTSSATGRTFNEDLEGLNTKDVRASS